MTAPKKPTPAQKARAAEELAQAKLRWSAAAYTDLARALALHARLDKLDPAVAFREARLVAEPHDFDPRVQQHTGDRDSVLALIGVARRRSEQALTALQLPVPKKEKEAHALAEAAWGRAGEPAHLRWIAGLKPGELFTISPFQVTLAGEGLEVVSALYEPRLDDPLDQRTGLYHSVVVVGRAVRAPIHVVPLEKPTRLEVRAGSRRTRAARAAWRVGLWALADVAKGLPLPQLPPDLRALLPTDSDDDLAIFVADNLTHSPETPWTTISRLAQGAPRLSVKELMAETGLSQRTVTYYLSLATLAPALLVEGRAGRMTLKLGSTLATIPDLALQVRLYELTAQVGSEATRISEINRLAQLGADKLAKLKPLQPLQRRATIPVKAARERLSASSSPSPELALLRAFVAALDGEEAALAQLPADVREALVEQKKPTQRRRLTSATNRPRVAETAPEEGP